MSHAVEVSRLLGIGRYLQDCHILAATDSGIVAFLPHVLQDPSMAGHDLGA